MAETKADPNAKQKRIDEIAEKKAKLLAQMNELDRKQKKLTMTKDESRAHRNHLFILLAGSVIAACRKNPAFKEQIKKLLEAEIKETKRDDRKEDFTELLSTFS
jgi:predicted transcriptional regulator